MQSQINGLVIDHIAGSFLRLGAIFARFLANTAEKQIKTLRETFSNAYIKHGISVISTILGIFLLIFIK